MDIHDIKDQIVQVACDKALHMCFPVRTNLPDLKAGGKMAFRVPDDGQPFGFNFGGSDIEVHVSMVSRTIEGTAVHQMVPSLTIWGITDKGTGVLIAEKVLPTERSF